jgi:uncharacterized protein YaiI (UPF0178 family)
MQIWVDADACPKPVKEILFRLAMKRKIRVTLVANQQVAHPRSPFIKSLQVPHGFDAADNEIVQRVTQGELVITADIPLAAAVIDKDAHALSPRGEMFTKDNMAEKLSYRNLSTTLRDAGLLEGGGQTALSDKDKSAFANALDRFLASRPTLDPSP